MSSKASINIKNKFDRVVILVDMDCFYCQVEEKLNPAMKGKPIAVVQYNPWQGGGIIAVNYPARADGVTRHMRGDEAKQHCPEIELPQVPQVRGKADLTRYREAGKEVADVLKSFSPLLERASIDEAYLDITERVLIRIREMNEGKFHLLPDRLANTFAVGYENIGEFVKKLSNTFETGDTDNNSPDQLEYKKSDIKLLVGASIVNEIRAAVKERTGYECSAGIAHNKILAKLTAGFHKPNKQTILPINSIPKLYETLPLKKVKGLGGKLGDQVCEVLKINFMSELLQFPESLLQQHFDERMGSWMYLMARGIDLEAVTPKYHSKSIGCCKRFPGKNAITGLATLTHWLNELASEVIERLEKDLDENNRTAKQLTVSYSQQIENVDVSSTRSIPLVVYDTERIAVDSLETIKRNTERFFKPNSNTTLHNAIKFLGISAGKFEPNAAGKSGGIKQMFQSYTSKTINAGEGTSKAAHQKSVAGTAVADVEGTNSLHIPPSMDESKDTTVAVINKPKSHIGHFLQHQASLASASKQDGNGSDPTINGEKSIIEKNTSSSSAKAHDPECSKPTKGIKEFLQQKSIISDPSAASNEILKEQQITEASSLLDGTSSSSVRQSGMDNDQPSEDTEGSDYLEGNSTIPPIQEGAKDQTKQQTSNDQTNGTVTEQEAIVQQVLVPEQKSKTNYKETYAEFCYDAPQLIPVTKECPQCNKSIPEHEYVSHQDFHFALSLSQQQRDEFRNDLKSKMVSNVSSGTSSKSSKSPFPVKRASGSVAGGDGVPTNPSITRFLTKVSPASSSSGSVGTALNGDPAVQAAVRTECPECGKHIQLESMAEHNDYHVAKRLQQELNRLEASSQPVAHKPPLTVLGGNISIAASSNAKRKRPSTAAEEVLSPVKQKLKPVSSYFTKL